MTDLTTLISEARPWATSVAIIGQAGIIARFWLANRKLRIAENQADRDGWGVLIRALQEDVALVRAEHRKCEERLSKIEGELNGFHRQALLQSQQGVAVLPASPMVQDAGERAVAAARAANGDPA